MPDIRMISYFFCNRKQKFSPYSELYCAALSGALSEIAALRGNILSAYTTRWAYTLEKAIAI